MTITQSRRRRWVEMQGFVGLDDETLSAVEPWLRLAPAMCMIWTGIGTLKASWLIIWSLVPFALLGAVLRGHPFDLIYEWGFRRRFDLPPIPRYGIPRRMACGVGAIWLTVTGWAFFAGATLVGMILGTSMFLIALVQVATGFCIPSFVRSLLFGERTSKLQTCHDC